MKKDKRATIRINGEILELLKKCGMSVQKVIDEYIEKRFKYEQTVVERKGFKRSSKG